MENMFGKYANRVIAAAAAAVLAAGALPFAAAAEGAGRVPSAAASAAAAAESNQADAYRIVALGDSLAAGYEYGMDRKENPVAYGFTERMYEQALFQGLRAEYRNYGIIGLKAEGMRTFLASAARGENLTAADVLDTSHESYTNPRARAIAEAIVGDGAAVRDALAEADLVLIQIGGNDFKAYADFLAEGTDPERRLAELLDAYAASLEASLRSVYAVGPTAGVVIGDQYSPLPETASNYETFQAAAAALTERLEEVAAKFEAEGYAIAVARPSAKFKGFELKYTALAATALSGKPDIHPNQSGYQAMAEAYAEAVWGEFRKPAERPADVPLSVVVNGKEIVSDNKPLMRNNYSYLALADVSAALQAAKGWDGKTKTATLVLNGRKAELAIGKTTMLVNGEPVAIPAAPFEQNGRTYVPLGALSDALGFEVVFRNTIKTAFLNG